MTKKVIPIDYTARDFDSIRRNLLEHAKRYYPNTYRDFNKAGFGSLMLDTVAYVGDVLSFYLDHQANESFLETAVEYQNVIKLSRAMGYNYSSAVSSFGNVQFTCLLPAASDSEPDMRYAPTIKAGTRVSNSDGVVFTLLDDVRFSDAQFGTLQEARADESGFTTYYSIQAFGRVVSGIQKSTVKRVGSFQRFLKLNVIDDGISEILSVQDSDGNEFLEVADLSQECVYQPITNPKYDTSARGDTQDLLRKVAAPRRFTVQFNRNSCTLQFGHGSPLTDISGSVVDPSNSVLKRQAKTYYSDSTFDPTRLTNNDKLGIAPANTNLTIKYRKNTSEFTNATAGSVTTLNNLIVEYESQSKLEQKIIDFINSGMMVTNIEPINGDVSLPSVDEIKMRAKGAFSSQARAVTAEDYANMVYSMPFKFGAIKRCRALKSVDELTRGISIYVVGQDSDGTLSTVNRVVKSNLKNYLNDARVMNDSLKILDARIFNFGVEYTITIKRNANKHEVIALSNNRLKAHFARKMDIGEPIYFGDIYSELKKVQGLLDVVNIDIVSKTNIAGSYSAAAFNVERQTSLDGSFVTTPTEFSIFELRFPNRDIRGTVI